jgi:hypothetical protein
MKQEIPYKAAASAAVAIATGREPEKLLIQNVAQHLQLSNPTQRKAFESFLRGFEQPRLLRLVAELRNEAKEAPALAAPLGEVPCFSNRLFLEKLKCVWLTRVFSVVFSFTSSEHAVSVLNRNPVCCPSAVVMSSTNGLAAPIRRRRLLVMSVRMVSSRH